MRKNKAEYLGFLITGVTLGAVTALLYAPQNGIRTRKLIRREVRRRIGQLDDLQDDVRFQVNDWVEEVQTAVEDGLQRGKRLTVAGREKVLGVFDEATNRLEEGKIRIEGLIPPGE